ncbi:3-oxoacyl-ACP synthase [uncultured Algibacter sp.]|uniref:3-oxoacyl-ACP synthase n=1 Tax=uncultured Algibacter sp. TaxID=298659 RepID=UPI002635E410|nr:3-oxoacyl-ACP synthase [uncultured Algibacter sp.]
MNENLNTKKDLYRFCSAFVEGRLETIKSTIKDIQISLTTETKSSAGDKYETGRAMLHLEREKAGNQLVEIQKVKETLSKIDIDKSLEKVGLGSVVFTSNLNYFIAISAGEIMVKGVKFYAVSASTPIAKLLLSKTVGNHVQFRNSTFTITKIW